MAASIDEDMNILHVNTFVLNASVEKCRRSCFISQLLW